MPRKKAVKTKTNPEDDERQKKLESLLKQFDMEVETRLYDMHRKTEQAVASINGIYKLALLRMPTAVKNALWENSNQPLPEAAESVAAVLREAEQTVERQKQRAGRRGRPRAQPPPAAAEHLVTPLQPPLPLHASTPAVTPKFDPRAVPSTARRRRPREVLMSFQGSPVVVGDAEGPQEVAAAQSAAEATRRAMEQVLQTAPQLMTEQRDELDDDTVSLMARLRDQLIDLTNLSTAKV